MLAEGPHLLRLPPTCPVVIGEAADIHVKEIQQRLGVMGTDVTCMDAFTLATHGFRLNPQDPELNGAGASRGWIRRLAPPNFLDGVRIDSHAGVVATSWLTLLTGIIETLPVHWLTTFRDLLSAESKLVQLRAAAACGFDTPRTLVTSELIEVRDFFSESVLVKPLGAGQLVDDNGEGLAIPATDLAVADLDEAEVRAAPFIFQEVLVARRHHRVVTVHDQVWSAHLDASGLPIDWRQHEQAHSAFVADEDSAAQGPALELARALRVGYSSQDWLETDNRLVFLDLNPSGQWLFLPRDIAEPASAALASWLANT